MSIQLCNNDSSTKIPKHQTKSQKKDLNVQSNSVNI